MAAGAHVAPVLSAKCLRPERTFKSQDADRGSPRPLRPERLTCICPGACAVLWRGGLAQKFYATALLRPFGRQQGRRGRHRYSRRGASLNHGLLHFQLDAIDHTQGF